MGRLLHLHCLPDEVLKRYHSLDFGGGIAAPLMACHQSSPFVLRGDIQEVADSTQFCAGQLARAEAAVLATNNTSAHLCQQSPLTPTEMKPSSFVDGTILYS